MKALLVALAIASSLLGCSDRPSASHFVAVLDELRVPSEWTLAHSAIRAPGSTFIACDALVNTDCPSAHRFYLVEGTPAPAYAEARAMVVAAGFTVTDELRPDCAGSTNPILACQLTASKGGDGLTVVLSEPGLDREELNIAESGKSIVELRAYPLPVGRTSS